MLPQTVAYKIVKIIRNGRTIPSGVTYAEKLFVGDFCNYMALFFSSVYKTPITPETKPIIISPLLFLIITEAAQS